MSISWGQVFKFPLRRPSILLKLWLLHLLPLLAIIPLLISGALTAVGAAVASNRPAFEGAALALGVGTGLAYLFFVGVALFCGLYPLGYFLEVARSVSEEEAPIPLPLGRWLVRPLKGLYFGMMLWLMVHVSILAVVLPVALVLVALAPHLPKHALSEAQAVILLGGGGLAFYAVLILIMLVSVNAFSLRLIRTLNPLRAANPIAMLGDLRRGWKDFFILQVACMGLYTLFWGASLVIMVAAPFLVAGPLLLIPGVLIGLGQNYLMLASANASGQFARLYVQLLPTGVVPIRPNPDSL